MIEDFIEKIIDDLARQKAKDIDDVIFEFLRKNGYRPKRTEKYAKNLSKRLAKKGLILKVEEIILEEKFTGTKYVKRCVYVPMFIHIEEIGGSNGDTKYIKKQR